MAGKKKGLSFDEHVELGQKMRETKDTLVKAFCTLANAYSERSEQVRRIEGARKDLDRAKEVLDDIFYTENQGYTGTSPYYGLPNKEILKGGSE